MQKKMNYIRFFVFLQLFWIKASECCNEFICGSVVSKCLITQSCDCDLTNCFCCDDCIICLGELYLECCSCLELCPTQNATQSALSPKSEIGDFDGIPELFDTLTEVEDDQWTTYRFPIASSNRHLDPKSRLGDDIDMEAIKVKKLTQGPTVNCTVIFLNTCTSNTKCMRYCQSTGANSYRWFHDGCCECIGTECINYGINDSKCKACPEPHIDETGDPLDSDYDSEGLWDYGEEAINSNFD